MNPLRRMRGWLSRLTPPLLGLLATALFLLLLEAIGYAGLRLANVELQRRTARRHAWLGTRRPVSSLLSFFPLWGWGGGSTQLLPFLRKTGVRGARGFVLNDPDRDSAIESSASIRIFVLGGSTVRGYPHPPRHSIPAHMERMLNRRHEQHVDVVNAGTGGWTSVNEGSFLAQKILPFFDPDVVVVLDGANDAGLAVLEGQRKRAKSTRTTLRPTHPKLKRYSRQWAAFHGRPGFVVNQGFKALGIARYLEADRYFMGVLFGYLRGTTPRPFRSEITRYWSRYSLPPPLKQRLRRRFRSAPWLRRRLRNHPLPPWQRTRIRRLIAGWSQNRWEKRRQLLRKASREQLDTLRKLHPYSLPYDRLDTLPCRRVPLAVQPYVDRVQTALGAARGHGIPLLHVLQPTLVFKESRTPWERGVVASNVTKSLFGAGQYFTVYRGMCIDRVYRRFFERASEKLGRFAARRGQPGVVLDLSRRFEGTVEERFSDFVHYTREAHRLIARDLVERLESMEVW